MPSEREKMLAGQLYDALDPDLVAARARVRELCQQLNAARDSDEETRRQLCKRIFGKGGDTVWMQPPFFCDYGFNIELGERVFFNFNCIVLDVCRVRIGDFTLFGPGAQVLTPVHPFNAARRRKEEYARPIDIGSDVWVGAGALVLPGVTIGSRSVIGAGSVVSRDIPEGVLAAGNPCRVIRAISEDERAEGGLSASIT
jgi:maltose O-acetyltransferase